MKDSFFIFKVRVVPRASKSEIVGTRGGALMIRIAAPPVEGAANAELIMFLAKAFGVSKSEVEVINGHTAKIKQVKIANTDAEKFRQIANLK